MNKSKIFFIFIVFIFCVFSEADTNQIRVGIYENPPKIYIDSNGNAAGFWAEITNYVAAKENWELEWVFGSWQDCLNRLQAGEIDLMVDVAYTSEREKKYLFGQETVLSSWTSLYIHADSELNSILDLNNKKVGALKGSVNLEGEDGLKELINSFQLHCEIVEYSSYIEVFQALEGKEIFAGITNRYFGSRFEREYNVKRTSVIFQPAHLHFAYPLINENSKELSNTIDHYLKNLKQDQNSLYYRALRKYIGGAQDVKIFPVWIKILLVIIIILALILYIFIRLLKHEVKLKTRELQLNITKLQKVQDELQLMVSRWETTFNSIQEAIMLINVDNVIQEINAAGCQLAGKTKTEIIGKKCYEVFHNSKKIPDFCPCQKSLKYKTIQTEQIYENGKHYEVTAWPIFDKTGEINGFSHAIIDITQRKKAEDKLTQYRSSLESLVKERTAELEDANIKLKSANDKLLEASHLKSQFLANMSHELRSPLNSIIGFTGIILQGISGKLNSEQEKQLKMVYESAKHLLGLINDILDLSKIEAGKIKIIAENFEVRQLLETVLKMMTPLANEKGLQMFLHVEENVCKELYSDRNRIKQILINLLSNAVKFTEEGEIKVTCYNNAESKELVFCVEDTGIGIKEEDLQGIFDEFTQVESERRIKPDGTGLGLAISVKMAKLMKGRLWLESKYGEGSKFFLAIPLERKKIERVSEEIEYEFDSKSKLILTIDDDEASQEILRTHLQKAGYEVIQAYRGKEALKYAEKYQPFAITLDIVMPGRDGWEILNLLKENPATQKIPVICISMLDNRELGISLGAVEYLIKPIDSELLLKELQRLENNYLISKIVIIDDEERDRNLLQEFLRSYKKYSILTADGGKKGIELVKCENPDLIILDLMMPEIDGFEVIRQLKLDEDANSIPIIIVSSKVIDDSEMDYLNSRISGIIRKGDFKKERILDSILQLIKKIERRKRGSGNE